MPLPLHQVHDPLATRSWVVPWRANPLAERRRPARALRERPTTAAPPKLTFDVAARRLGAHGSSATCKSAAIRLDTGSSDAGSVFGN
jgi:hypothetical protein